MNNTHYIKVCGNVHADNAREVAAARPDLMGFVFHKLSPRYASMKDLKPYINHLPHRIRKVGVFVDMDIDEIKKHVVLLDLHLVQLHGSESPEYCAALRKRSDFGIIKVFHVDDDFDFSQTEPYNDVVHFFLFDTKGANPGGNGRKFNWEKLNEYQGELSFFLAGGIGPKDAEEIKALNHEKLIGLDLNSGFETAPAQKDTDQLNTFITALRS